MTTLTVIRTRVIALLASIVMLAGCQEVLYSELSEQDANEMVALLVLSGIPAKRQKDAAQVYSVTVEEEDLPVAVTVLRNAGLPREKFSTFGEIFGDSGVVGTPFEERVRFAYAVNEELAHTLTQIKGIEQARVHVVIPPEERFGKSTEKARASVAIFHDKSFDPTEYTTRIKTLVAFAVPGLEVEAVSTSFFLAPGFVVQPLVEGAASGTAVADSGETVTFFPRSAGQIPFFDIALVIIALLVVRSVTLLLRRIRRGRQNA